MSETLRQATLMLTEALADNATDDAKQILLDYLEEHGIARNSLHEHPARPGEVWMFHNVTRYIVGRVTRMTPLYAWLTEASWIQDEGRAMDAVKKGSFNTVEPLPVKYVVIHLGSGNDDEGPLTFDPPTKQK